VNEEKEKAERGPASLQRGPRGGESAEGQREKRKAELRTKIRSIREGHTTGGYCDTEKLKIEEKELHKLLSEEFEAACAIHGYSPDPKFKHKAVRDLEVELNGLSWKPKYVVAEESK
jgi:hypothetical protein